MTGLTSAICKNAATYTTGKLLDSGSGRGNKSYWVTKFKDGNCWMTQNLDYDDPNSTKVANPSDWTSKESSYRAYYDPGTKTYTDATLDAIDAGGWTPTYNENFVAAAQYVGTDDQTICTKTANALSAPVNSPSQCKIYYYTYYTPDYKEHMTVGNYYSYLAATNGTGSSISSGNASGSICPSGWKLPTSNNTSSGSFGELTTAENIPNSAAGWEKIKGAPYYFVRGGLVSSGNLDGAGSRGRYWSSTAYDGAQAYVLYFDSSRVSPSSNSNRYGGFSIRCLVQGS